MGLGPETPPEAEGPAFPHELDYLWRWYQELVQGLDVGFSSVRVTWQSLGYWREQTQVEIDPWEARALIRLGVTYSNVQVEAARAAAPKVPTPRQPFTPRRSSFQPRGRR